MTVKLSDVKTPTTVEDFRNNLRKFCVCVGNDLLMVRDYGEVNVNELSSLSDLFEILKDTNLNIIPTVELSMDDVTKFMNETNQHNSCNGFFNDENNYKLYESVEFRKKGEMKWVRIDNQIYREFFMKVFGEFSGYQLDLTV